MLSYNDKGGWLFDDPIKNEAHRVSQDEILSLIELEDEDNQWVNAINRNARDMTEHPGKYNFFSSLVTIQNAGGTVLRMPYGFNISFPSRKHLFRGENRLYLKCLPSLYRHTESTTISVTDKNPYYVLAQLRIQQFRRFIWQFHIVPYWEAKICDVNYKALAQHYGFDTTLIDFTNDVRTAVFFAASKYVWETDSYKPLTWDDINSKQGETNFGRLYVSPDWATDFLQVSYPFKTMQRIMDGRITLPNDYESGYFDEECYQIGYQPLMRCAAQSGYIYPMRNGNSPIDNYRFEKLEFPQSPEFSQKIFEMMNGGKKVFPNEGISRVISQIREMRTSLDFSNEDFEIIYNHDDTIRKMYSSKNEMMDSMVTYSFDGDKIAISQNNVEYKTDPKTKDEINAQYDAIDLGKYVGGIIYQTPEAKAWREQRCREIYGELSQGAHNGMKNH